MRDLLENAARLEAKALQYEREIKVHVRHNELARRAVVVQKYGENIPSRNLHFIMRNMAMRPWQFIVISLLRSGLDPDQLARQRVLF